jgi:hypothetical protein
MLRSEAHRWALPPREMSLAHVRLCSSEHRKSGLDVALERVKLDATATHADSGRLYDHDRFYSEITKRKGKLEVVFANGDIYEIKPHDQAIEDAGSLCFCRLRKRMMRSSEETILIWSSRHNLNQEDFGVLPS